MDFIIGLIIFIGIIVVIFVAMNAAKKRREAEVWTGTVVKKWIASYTNDDGDSIKTPMIQVEKEDGKKKKLSVSSQTYDALNEGDKVSKEAGVADPVKA